MLLPAVVSIALLAALGQGQTTSADNLYTSSLPPQSAYTPPPAGVANGALPPVSYTYDFTVTTATTDYISPTFQTPAPVPACSDNMCPALDGKVCIDEMGTPYGVMCDTHLIGIIITTSGKRKRDGKDVDDDDGSNVSERDMREPALAAGSLGERDANPEAEGSLEDRELYARTFTGSFNGCADYCDMVSGCLGMSLNAGFRGNCQSMASIEGAFPAKGEIAAFRQ